MLAFFLYLNVVGLILTGIGLWMASKNNIWSCLVIALAPSIISLIGIVVAIIMLKNREEINKNIKDTENEQKYIE